MIVHVRPDEAARGWAFFEPMIAEAMAGVQGCYEPLDCLRDILNGDQVMWASWDKEADKIEAVMTTRIVEHRGVGNVLRRKVINIVYVAGGNMSAWISEFVETIEKYARDMGCTGGTGAFREGWLRVWPGAKKNGVNLFKDL